MIIEELKLTLFKGFREFTLACSPFTCLVGLNSQGKTSILQAIRLLHDIITFAFGNRDQPDFANPQWRSNPSQVINRLAFGDPDAIWLNKKTSDTCKIAARYTGNIEVFLEISGRNNYDLDIRVAGSSIKDTISDPTNGQAITDIFLLRPAYLPPVGAVSPTEDLLHHPQLTRQMDMGRDSECWRSGLYWLWNDGNRASFDQLVQLVQQYLPDAQILPPRLTHDQPPKVLIEFEEGETKFDISTSGGGFRTLLNLATVLHFSPARCILCDEPDSHLHGSLQRAIARMLLDFSVENNRQVFVATHAPDFIAETPVESIVWIDRTQREGRRCSDIGRVLADLGAISKADAVRAYGANKILFIEGSFDRAALERLLGLAGGMNLFADPSVLIGTLPSGKGDAIHLRTFGELLRNVFKLDVAIACLTDNDYDLGTSDANRALLGQSPLLLSLGRKEVENYLLDAQALAGAMAVAAERRNERTDGAVAPPSRDVVSAKLAEIINEKVIRDTVRLQLVPQYRETLDRSLDASTREAKAEQWFQERWNDEQWRICHCPGKAVLKKVREWCTNEYGLTLTTKALTDAVTACPSDIGDIAQRLQAFFRGSASVAVPK